MPAPIRKYDALGFPIPSTFEDLPGVGPDTSRGVIDSPRTVLTIRRKRIFVAVILLVVAAFVFGPHLKGASRDAMIAWRANQAKHKLQAGDYQGAVDDLTAAIDWGGRRPDLFYYRALARLELDDLQGSLADLDYLTRHHAHRVPMNVVYSQRAWVHIRLGNKQQAVDDADRSVKMGSGEDPAALNHRAYIRALANLNEADLRAGLKDIEQALSMVGERNPEFLDTRGYLRHLLGDNQGALLDMDLAIPMIEARRERRDADVRELNRSLAVMYFHRSLIHRSLKNDERALADSQLAEQLGYNPAAGVM